MFLKISERFRVSLAKRICSQHPLLWILGTLIMLSSYVYSIQFTERWYFPFTENSVLFSSATEQLSLSVHSSISHFICLAFFFLYHTLSRLCFITKRRLPRWASQVCLVCWTNFHITHPPVSLCCLSIHRRGAGSNNTPLSPWSFFCLLSQPLVLHNGFNFKQDERKLNLFPVSFGLEMCMMKFQM